MNRLLKLLLYTLLLPLIYIIASLILTELTINRKESSSVSDKIIFLNTNGVHLDIILSKNDIHNELLNNILHLKKDVKYISFGWGDENFYINTPTWNDLTFSNAFQAMFMKSSTLVHLTRYKEKQDDWKKIEVNENELKKLNIYILNTFKKDEKGNIIILKDKGYFTTDDFYKAEGSYSCFKTCNSWVNSGFKESDLKSCYWTPFDYGLLKKYN